MNNIKKSPGFKFTMIAICAVIIAFFVFTPPPEGLSVAGWRTLGLLIFTILMFISEAMNNVAICFTIIALMKYLGIDTMSNIVKNAAATSVFFSLAGMGIGGALKGTNLASIILRSLWKTVHGNPKRMITSFVLLAAIISVFVSDSAAQIVCIAVATTVVTAMDVEVGSSRLLGGIFMGITVGAMCGGLALPCSNTANVACMELAQTIAGIDMTFLQWALFGVPCAILCTITASICVPALMKPEKLSDIQESRIQETIDNIPNQLSKKDKFYLLITFIMVVLWIASNWISMFDTATVAMLGLAVMMLPIPGLQLIDLKGYKDNVSVMVPITMLCIFPLAKAMQASGLGEYLVNIIFADAANWSKLLLYVIVTLTVFVIHLLIPSGNAAGVLAVSVVGPLMVAAGIPVAAAIVCIGIQIGMTMLFPIEGTWQFTFGLGQYKFEDCLKNWPVQITSFLCGSLVIPAIAAIFGGIL